MANLKAKWGKCLNPLNRVSWLKIINFNSKDDEKLCLNPLNRVSWLKI